MRPMMGPGGMPVNQQQMHMMHQQQMQAQAQAQAKNQIPSQVNPNQNPNQNQNLAPGQNPNLNPENPNLGQAQVNSENTTQQNNQSKPQEIGVIGQEKQTSN